jgi:PAS domain-containing protein
LKEITSIDAMKMAKKLHLQERQKTDSRIISEGTDQSEIDDPGAYYMLTDRLTLGLIICNLKTHTLHANSTAEEILGLSSGQMRDYAVAFNPGDKHLGNREDPFAGNSLILSFIEERPQCKIKAGNLQCRTKKTAESEHPHDPVPASGK